MDILIENDVYNKWQEVYSNIILLNPFCVIKRDVYLSYWILKYFSGKIYKTLNGDVCEGRGIGMKRAAFNSHFICFCSV